MNADQCGIHPGCHKQLPFGDGPIHKVVMMTWNDVEMALGEIPKNINLELSSYGLSRREDLKFLLILVNNIGESMG